MMYRSFHEKVGKAAQMAILLTAILFLFCSTGSFAYGKSSRYVLIYKNLYDYGKHESDVLKTYCSLKSYGNDVQLLKADSIENSKIEKDDTLVIIPQSFDSESEYKYIENTCSSNKVMLYGEENFSEPLDENSGLYLEISSIYPFSDLNKLMNVSDKLKSLGISPVYSIMPVYDNYTLEAYDKFIDVLRYIGKNGGSFFIHEPIINADGTYNMDPKPLFSKAVEEYRKKGINIVGVRISMDRLFSNYNLYQGMNLPFIIVSKQEGKVNSGLDLYKASEVVNGHILLKCSEIDDFSIISYKAYDNNPSHALVSLDINKDAEKLDYLLASLRSERIPVRDFDTKIFNYNLDEGNTGTVVTDDGSKTQLDKFKEQEMEKINGSNLEAEKQGEKGYDISQIIATGIKISMIMIALLLIYIFIGRRLDIRKIFKL